MVNESIPEVADAGTGTAAPVKKTRFNPIAEVEVFVSEPAHDDEDGDDDGDDDGDVVRC